MCGRGGHRDAERWLETVSTSPNRLGNRRRVVMTLDEFLYVVRDRGEYDSRDEAEQVSRAVLTVLANRITPGEAKDLSAQLPAPLSSAAQPDDNRPDSYGVEEFCRRIAERVGGHTRTAE